MALDRRISLHKLEVFTLVVQLKGVGRAASHLGIAQPVVSRHLRSLEERLGVTLFYRDGHQMLLTESGAVTYAWAEDLLTRSREFDRDLDGLLDGSKGQIVFGASMSVGSYLLPPVISEFRTANPAVDLQLSILDSEHTIDDTRKGILDFVIAVTAPDATFLGLSVKPIGEERIVLVAAPGAEGLDDPISSETLGELPFVEAPQGSIRRGVVEHHLANLGIVERNVALEVGHPEAMKRTVQRGLGVAFMFRGAVLDELRSGQLKQIAVDGLDVAVPISLVHRQDKSLSAVHQKLIDSIRAALATSSEE